MCGRLRLVRKIPTLARRELRRYERFWHVQNRRISVRGGVDSQDRYPRDWVHSGRKEGFMRARRIACCSRSRRSRTSWPEPDSVDAQDQSTTRAILRRLRFPVSRALIAGAIDSSARAGERSTGVDTNGWRDGGTSAALMACAHRIAIAVTNTQPTLRHRGTNASGA
jgi:hypothetical protein